LIAVARLVRARARVSVPVAQQVLRPEIGGERAFIGTNQLAAFLALLFDQQRIAEIMRVVVVQAERFRNLI
jgi:hypothetical protein